MAQNGNGDREKILAILGKAVGALALVVGGGVGGHMLDSSAQASGSSVVPHQQERPVTRAEFEEVRSQGLGNEKKVLALEVEVRVGLGNVSAALDLNTRAIHRVEAELVEQRKARR